MFPQHLVDESSLTFAFGNITDVTDKGFNVALSGALLDTGPFDAQIITPAPGFTVTWEGNDIATIELPTLCSAAVTAIPDLETNAVLTITNLGT